jgi:TRAP-type C4-dicarboxylate transport system substrate-binding protein
VEAEDKATDAYLQARAKQAEAYAQLTEYEFKILQYFENMSEADWAAIPPEHQKEVRAALDRVREEMPEWLASLPIEKRRQLEGLE